MDFLPAETCGREDIREIINRITNERLIVEEHIETAGEETKEAFGKCTVKGT